MTIEQLLDKISEKNFSQEISKLPQHILIYGAGAFGKEIYMLLKNHNRSVMGFIDRSAAKNQELFKVPVWSLENIPDSIIDCSPVVVFAIVMDKTERLNVINSIKQAGFSNVIEAQSLRCLMVEPADREITCDLKTYYKQRWDKIEKTSKIFEDCMSEKLYWENVIAHMTKEYSGCITECPMQEQYFPENIGWGTHHYIVDCGAYIGDTAQQLVNKNGKLNRYIGIEPNLNNFIRLSTYCKTMSQQLGEVTLFPCGVSGQTLQTTFNTGTGSGCISENGDQQISCVALDDIIQNQKIDLIKMDIEGAELDALNSAKNMIAKYCPDLAICVYHNTNHIWDIPKLIDSWNLGYKFYLRCYNAFTMETVLYAKSNKKE